MSNQETNNMNYVLKYLANNFSSNNLNPIEKMNPEEITYLQSYLEHLKQKKINVRCIQNVPKSRATEIYDPLNRNVPVDWRSYHDSPPMQTIRQSNEPGSRGAAYTRIGKKSEQKNDLDHINQYYNPYEYSTKQNSLPPQYKSPYLGPYFNDPNVLNHVGIPDANNVVTDHIRNMDIESSLLQREMTHLPGQRELTGKEINRFELLPFDPQDHRHIVWEDGMPRGGYPTRNDRLDLGC